MEIYWEELPWVSRGNLKGLFRCVCGVVRVVVRNDIRRRKSTSCGCVYRALIAEKQREAVTKHGMAYSPEWGAWVELRRRCRASHRHDSVNYSRRGIGYDPRWETFENFFTDMGPRPEGCSLGRINNDLGYCKENCRWETRKQQERNKRSNRLVTIFCQTVTVAEACEVFGASSSTVYGRLNRGWPPEKAVLTKAASRR